ncbi:uncharacterized protein (DUF58 family) [Chitinophaga niastensis]|uniref:Uncharacterized protein (DUF58 family) n=1 Tax=Chitinophaga niastensis TaxID=536980 RepID=A0A2P8HML6_CHINA|nr:DUF58 domain-containing protein [Chitinophaga niastensis]PSL47465.1 uncharacterized protein (DUF58 family) [Chitinophaga niastensis]
MSATVKNNLYQLLFFTNRLYLLLSVNVLLFIIAFFFPRMYNIAIISFIVMIALLLLDMVLVLLRPSSIISLERKASVRFSNGDQNEVVLTLHNQYPFPVFVSIIDELPFQFQERDFSLKGKVGTGEQQRFHYNLRPVERGVYQFGYSNVFIKSALGMVSRRFVFDNEQTVSVYPSFHQLRHYALYSYMNRLNEIGVHKRRVIGHSMEFDHIKPYTKGDDVRMLNWKATARTGNLMVNNYVEEKSQQVYCVIDKGRTMKMPFNGLSLLDYAINASLVFSNVAVNKGDKAGLVTFTEKKIDVLAASNKKVQLNKILETLYSQETQWQESDYEALSVQLRSSLSTRSLLMLFTNFESMSSLQRQLPFLRRLARYHLVLVVFFENTELKKVTEQPAYDIEGIYKQTIAQKFAYDKKLIVKELAKYGIMSLLSPPEHLTLNVVNKYLELKARMLI